MTNILNENVICKVLIKKEDLQVIVDYTDHM